MASVIVLEQYNTTVSTQSPLLTICNALQYTVNSIYKKDESFDTDRSLYFVYSSTEFRGVSLHTVLSIHSVLIVLVVLVYDHDLTLVLA